MRKKIIKSYFFNNSVKNPATNSLFCFSKRAFKQSKQYKKTSRWIQNNRKSKKTLELIRYYTQYKNNINTKINLNQWVKNDEKLILFFLKSYYFNKKLISKINKKKTYTVKQLKLWMLFKNKFFKTLKKRLFRFPKTGVLSSHYVHILSRKNITYQTRSKYRSKTLNLNFFNYYFYFFTKFTHIYVHTLNSALYYFSTNPVNKTIWSDDDFYTHTSNWSSGSLNIKKKNYLSIARRHKFFSLLNLNVFDIDNTVIVELYHNKQIINDFLLEEDQIKRDSIFLEISNNISSTTLNYLHLVNMFVFSSYLKNYSKNLYNPLFLHTLIYKKMYKLI